MCSRVATCHLEFCCATDEQHFVGEQRFATFFKTGFETEASPPVGPPRPVVGLPILCETGVETGSQIIKQQPVSPEEIGSAGAKGKYTMQKRPARPPPGPPPALMTTSIVDGAGACVAPPPPPPPPPPPLSSDNSAYSGAFSWHRWKSSVHASGFSHCTHCVRWQKSTYTKPDTSPRTKPKSIAEPAADNPLLGTMCIEILCMI